MYCMYKHENDSRHVLHDVESRRLNYCRPTALYIVRYTITSFCYKDFDKMTLKSKKPLRKRSNHLKNVTKKVTLKQSISEKLVFHSYHCNVKQ